MRRSKLLLISLFLVLAYITAFATFPALAWAIDKPASTKSLFAGPSIINVNLYQDPPVTDQSSEVTVMPHEENLRLYGRILMVPGLGTDAVELHSNLVPVSQTNTLVGTLRMPVRGAWQIVIQLNGPGGAGEASFSVSVAGPGAMPFWMAWLIALTPLLGIAWMIRHQRRYRENLLVQSH